MPRLKLPPRETVHVDALEATVYAKPMGKPRMTQSDKWNQRPSVVRSRKLADDIREAFGLKPMDKFKSAGKIEVYCYFHAEDESKFGKIIHQAKPDASNCLKECEDSLLDKDEMLYSVHCEKAWTQDKDHLVIKLTDVEKYV
jgi:hypothetical protein